MDEQKKCPLCANQIPLEAKFCSHCGAQFEVVERGYCTNCHKMVTTGLVGLCSICSRQVLDVHLESSFIEGARPQARHLPPAYLPIQPSAYQQVITPRQCHSGTCLRSILVVVVLVAAFFIVNFIWGFIKTTTSSPTTGEKAGVAGTQQPRPTRTTMPTPGPSPIPTLVATPTPSIELILNPSAPAGSGFFLTNRITSLDSSGWHPSPPGFSNLQEEAPYDMATCTDGTILFFYSGNYLIFDGKNFKSLNDWSGINYSSHSACNSTSDIWLTGNSSLGHFDGHTWVEYSQDVVSPTLKLDDYSNEVVDIALQPSGDFFVIQEKNITRYAGAAWQSIKEGEGFTGALVDNQGQLWVAYGKGFLLYKDNTWQDYQYRDGARLYAKPAIDSAGRLWVALGGGSVLAFDPPDSWSEKKIDEQLAFGPEILALAFDGAGRLWVGTEYGLLVYDGNSWQTFHMHTSDLGSNDVRAIAFSGDPGIPEQVIKPYGSMSGRFIKAGAPLGVMPVEVCVNGFGFLQRYSTTPCTGQPFVRQTTTDADGKFTLSDIPTGYYVLTFKDGDRWTQMAGMYGMSSRMYLVEPGKNMDTGDIEIEE
jgi:hypothetical protein